MGTQPLRVVGLRRWDASIPHFLPFNCLRLKKSLVAHSRIKVVNLFVLKCHFIWLKISNVALDHILKNVDVKLKKLYTLIRNYCQTTVIFQQKKKHQKQRRKNICSILKVLEGQATTFCDFKVMNFINSILYHSLIERIFYRVIIAK